MFSGVFALQPCKPPTAVGASQGRVALVARRTERNSPKTALFFLGTFSFARSCSKEKVEFLFGCQNCCKLNKRYNQLGIN